MAIQGPIPIDFGMVFPAGAYAAGAIEMVRDFDRSSGDRIVQQVDKHTGLPLWVVEVIDADESARQRTVKVKLAAQVQPVLPPPVAGSPSPRWSSTGWPSPLRGHGTVPGKGHRPLRCTPGVLAEGHRRAGSLAGDRPPG